MSSTMARREQEHLERRGHPRAEQRQHAEREGDVGRHRDAPAGGARPAGVEGEVERGGHDHAAERGDGRQRGGAAVAQLARDAAPA